MQKKRIVVLDGHTLNPGDLSWEALESLGSCTVYARTPEAMILDRAKDADILLTNKTPLTAETINQLPHLRYIGVLATGYNCVDVKAAAAQGIPVCNIPKYGTNTVAQYTFALLLALCHRVEIHNDAVQDGEWARTPDFCFVQTPQVELDHKILGILGFGRIGRQVARIGRAMGMNIHVCSRTPSADPEWKDVVWVDKETLFAESDVISLHCPLTPETEKIVNATHLGKMKRTAFLLNTSRGGLIDEPALRDALDEGKIAGAALDVLSNEPPHADHPLMGAKNCLITPHMAWTAVEARRRIMDITISNLRQFLAGNPVHVVNEPLKFADNP